MSKKLPPGTVHCRLCKQPTTMLGTQLCDPCWGVDRNINRVSAVYLLEELKRRGVNVEVHFNPEKSS